MKSISPLIDSRKPGLIVIVLPSPRSIVFAVDAVLNMNWALALMDRPRPWPKSAPT